MGDKEIKVENRRVPSRTNKIKELKITGPIMVGEREHTVRIPTLQQRMVEKLGPDANRFTASSDESES